MRSKLTVLGIVFPVIIVLDFISKRWALEALANGNRIDLLGGLLPLTLAYNKGAAFGIGIGDDSRWLFVPITVVALFLLVSLYRQSEKTDLVRHLALALVISGAIGNLYDRVRWDMGVVDFLGPVDLGFWDFPIFNVADMAISCGAVLLAFSFWVEGKEEARAKAQAEAAGKTPAGASEASGLPGGTGEVVTE